MLTITNLSVSTAQKEILNNFNLILESGALEVIMGPNGSGKSTLAYTLMGHPDFAINKGKIFFNNEEITQLAIDKRAQKGIFLAFQNPIELPGVSVFSFLKESYFALHKTVLPNQEFQELIYFYLQLLALDPSFAHRNVHQGFSGGEKKKFELLQLLLLKPRLAVLDEIDSGLDADALKIVAQNINYARKENPPLTILLITHTTRLTAHINPSRIHVMQRGTILKSGNSDLAHGIEQRGFDAVFQ